MAVGRKDRGAALTVAAKVVAVAVLTTLLQAGHAGAFGIPEFLEFGECAPIKPQPDLNFERYSGIWFNIEMVPNEYADITYCSMTNYTWDKDLMLVEERGLNDDGVKMKQGSLMYPTEGQKGVLTVDAEGVPSAPYVVVATDYDRYSCVHSCLAMMGFRAAFSWVMSRQPTLEPALIAHCRERLQELDIDTSGMLPVTQGKECPYAAKLASILDYSAKVQAKAKARELAVHKVKIDSTAEGVQTVIDYRMQDDKDMGMEENVHVHEKDEEEDQMMMRRNEVTMNQHTGEAAFSGCEVKVSNTALLLLLLTTILIMLTSPPS